MSVLTFPTVVLVEGREPYSVGLRVKLRSKGVVLPDTGAGNVPVIGSSIALEVCALEREDGAG